VGVVYILGGRRQYRALHNVICNCDPEKLSTHDVDEFLSLVQLGWTSIHEDQWEVLRTSYLVYQEGDFLEYEIRTRERHSWHWVRAYRINHPIGKGKLLLVYQGEFCNPWDKERVRFWTRGEKEEEKVGFGNLVLPSDTMRWVPENVQIRPVEPPKSNLGYFHGGHGTFRFELVEEGGIPLLEFLKVEDADSNVHAIRHVWDFGANRPKA